MSDVSRVLFPVDWNSALASLADVYASHGVIATIVAPKNPLPSLLDVEQARALVRDGVVLVHGKASATMQLFAIGAYQLQQALIAAERLNQRAVDVSVWAILEPGKFRIARDDRERAYCAASQHIIPTAKQRLFFCHTRPEIILGTLRTLDLGHPHTRALGYINRGGTLDTFGMLFANGCTWAHGVHALAGLCGEDPAAWLSADELHAVEGRGDPAALRVASNFAEKSAIP
jgi:phosphoketolase